MAEAMAGDGAAAISFSPLKYSQDKKNEFIIELSASLYANSDWVNGTKSEVAVARECIKRASTLYNELSGMFGG